MKKLFCHLLVLGVALVFVMSSANNVLAEKEVELGIIIPLTGPLSKIGVSTKMGYDMAADDVNSRGGIKSLGGAKLKLIYADDQAKPALAVSETEKLIERHNVPIVLGEYASSVTIAATVVAERLKVPFLVPISVSDKITERGFKYIFRLNAPASHWSRTIQDFLKDFGKLTGGKKEVKTIALVYEDSDWGQDTAKAHRDRAASYGFKIVADESYPHGAADVTAKIAKIKAAKPDALLPVSYIQDAMLIAETRARLGFNPIVVSGGGGALEPEYINLDVSDLEFTVSHWNRDISPAATELNKRFRTRYNTDMNGNMAACYQSILVVAEALENAGSVDRNAIRDALADLEINPGPKLIMPYKKINFDAKGQNDSILVVVQMEDKKTHCVWPEGFAASKVVVP